MFSMIPEITRKRNHFIFYNGNIEYILFEIY